MRVIWCGALVLTLAAPSAALACHNGVEIRVVNDSARTRSAERLLERGRLRSAFRSAGRTLERVKRARPDDPRRRLLEPRLLRVLSTVTIRLQGRVRRERWTTPRQVPAPVRAANLGWATDQLAFQARRDPGPVAQALWAEGLSATGQHAPAVRVLSALASSDLMPDAYGHAALARSLGALGRDDDRDRALIECRRAAGRARPGICFSPDAS